jgi:organic hydroperoxide reductase OsmC/OhrA
MTTFKEHRFPVLVRWVGGRLTSVSAIGKPDLQVATPPEFKGGIEGAWSPEDLTVAAVASCYTVTLVAIAERHSVPLRALDVSGTGHVTARHDGRFGFVAIELDVDLETEPGREADARRAAESAERNCLVSAALDAPVHVRLHLRAPAELSLVS